MYTSPEAVYLEMKLESKHVLALFHHIRKEQALSLKWFSTQTIVELINRVFSLHSHSIALEYKQFVDVLKRFGSLPSIIVVSWQVRELNTCGDT